MYRNIGVLLFVLSFAVFPLVVSGEDIGITKLFEKYENEWNNKSVDGLISCFHDGAKISTGADRATVSKTEYKQHLVARFERFGKVFGHSCFLPSKSNGFDFLETVILGFRVDMTRTLVLGADKTRWTPLTSQRASELPPAKVPHVPR
jgi:hypothetical protein